jgi:protein O-GlcNAc transferase
MNVNAKLRIGTQHHQAGRLKAAQVVYEEILDYFPDHPDALHLSGLIAHQWGNSDDGIKRIGRALEHRPHKTVFRENLAKILFDAGNVQLGQGGYHEAIDCFLKATEMEPANADFHHNLGVAHQETGALEKAISCYRQAVQQNPDLAEAHFNLGNALRIQNGVNDEVIAAYRSALAIRPDYIDASFNLAKTFDELERTEEAIASYAHTLVLDPDFVDAHNSMGNSYLKMGQYPLAISCYEQAIRINPGFHEGYYNMALACKLLGKLREAVFI